MHHLFHCAARPVSTHRTSQQNPPFVPSSGFDPFTTAFSRKSRTRLQERAEQGLAHLSDSQTKRQQRFSTLEERQVTILLPQQPHEASAETEEQEQDGEQGEADAEQCELELVAQLWRERMGNDEVERFETRAAKKLRLLRTAKSYPYVICRIRLPGGVYLQARFNSKESLEVRDWRKQYFSCQIHEGIQYTQEKAVTGDIGYCESDKGTILVRRLEGTIFSEGHLHNCPPFVGALFLFARREEGF